MQASSPDRPCRPTVGNSWSDAGPSEDARAFWGAGTFLSGRLIGILTVQGNEFKGPGRMGDKKAAAILVTKVAERRVDVLRLIQDVAHKRRVSKYRVAMEVIRRKLNRQGISYHDYFLFGMHRPELTAEDRDAFLGESAVTALNLALAPVDRGSLSGLLRNKILTAMVLEQAGIATAQIRGLYVTQGNPRPFHQMRSAQEIADFLLQSGVLPVFGKPVNGSRSLGAVSILAVAEPGILRLGDGRIVAALDLAQEIVAGFPGGYMFQDLLVPPAELALTTGPAISSLRVMSLWDGAAPQVLYTVLRLPARGAMADDFPAGAQNGMALLDHSTGKLIRAQGGLLPGGQDLLTSPATGQALADFQMPHWQALCGLAQEVHALFPLQTVVGIDLALTDKGPVVNEINTNPLHTLYQRASGRGILNAEFRPLLLRALAAQGVTKRKRGLSLP